MPKNRLILVYSEEINEMNEINVLLIHLVPLCRLEALLASFEI